MHHTRTTPSRQDRLTSTTLHLSTSRDPNEPRPNHQTPSTRCLAPTPPRPNQPNKKRPVGRAAPRSARLPLALGHPLQFKRRQRANRRAPAPHFEALGQYSTRAGRPVKGLSRELRDGSKNRPGPRA